MPIFEYKCPHCGITFEELVRGGNDDLTPPCPRCGEARTERIFSVFGFSGTSRASAGSSTASCGGCTSRHCSTCR